MNTKTVRTLTVAFGNNISERQVSAFRGAMIQKVGREHSLFHNHREEGFQYRYPLIQYKRIGKYAGLYCLGDGVNEIHKFFGLSNWDISIHGEVLPLTIERLELNSFTLAVRDTFMMYSIKNWLALNEENYVRYRAMSGMVDRLGFLERLLTGNILSFAKGIDWHIADPIRIQIQNLEREKVVRYKGVPLMAFDVTFTCNVFLPDHLGLGKSASHGFGVVKSNRKIKK